MIELDKPSTGTPTLLSLHPRITKMSNLWTENYCLYCISLSTASLWWSQISQAEGTGNANPPLAPLLCPNSSEYWGYYLSHLQSRGVERAIKVSHCPEIIIRWCLRPGLEIMSALVGPRGRRRGSEGMWDIYSCFVPWIIGAGIAPPPFLRWMGVWIVFGLKEDSLAPM